MPAPLRRALVTALREQLPDRFDVEIVRRHPKRTIAIDSGHIKADLAGGGSI